MVVVEKGCASHLVGDGVSGYACPRDDEEAFYEATLELLTNNDRRKNRTGPRRLPERGTDHR